MLAGCGEVVGKFMSIKNIVAQDQRAIAMADEVATDNEGLRQTVRAGLDCVGEAQAPLTAIAQKLFETRCILRRR